MYNVNTKSLAAIPVISKTVPVASYEDSSEANIQAFRDVRQVVTDNDAGYAGYDIALYHGIPGQTDLAIEAAIPVSATLPESEDIKQYELPAVQMVAYTIHYGGYETVHEAHGAIQQWMAENGYRPSGAVRDVYLAFDVMNDPKTWMTEIQYPVEKI